MIEKLTKKMKLSTFIFVAIIFAITLNLGLTACISKSNTDINTEVEQRAPNFETTKNPEGFTTEKEQLWNMIKATPLKTEYVVFINGFLGTSLVEKYLKETVKGNFSVAIVRSYKSSGYVKTENEMIENYNKNSLSTDNFKKLKLFINPRIYQI